MRKPLVAFAFLIVGIVSVGLTNPTRITILDRSPEAALNQRDFKLVRSVLAGELRELGIDAQESVTRFEDLTPNDSTAVDFYVEIAGADHNLVIADQRGVATGPTSSVLLTTMAGHATANLRVYDARSLKLIKSYRLNALASPEVPRSIGIGGSRGADPSNPFGDDRHLLGGGGGDPITSLIAAGLFRRSSTKEAMKAMARDAAGWIANDVTKR